MKRNIGCNSLVITYFAKFT